MLAVAAVAGAVGAVAGALVALFVASALGAFEDTEAPATADPSTLTIEQTDAISSVAAERRPGVVRIESSRTTSGGVVRDIGSGVLLDGEGHILTNAHIVTGTDSLKVTLSDGTERDAILLGHDSPYTDVAVLQIGPVSVEPIPVGSSSALALGDTVVAIGNPLATFDGSVTVGVVSGLARVRTFDGVRQDDLIQTDAAINSGNSGGALLNLQGELVGIPTAVLREFRNGEVVEGIAFALPIDRAMEIAGEIIRTGGSYPRPTLGISHVELTSETARQFGTATAEGALVTAVAPAGPAADAGILVGDVITEMGETVVNRDGPLLNALGQHLPGERVRVVLNRGGRIIESEVELGRSA